MAGSRWVLAGVVSSMIAGCATLPEFRDDPLSTAEVIRHIRCELRDAVWSHAGNEWAWDWKAGYTFILEVNHLGGLDSDNAWVFPLNLGATFSVALTGGFSGAGTRTENVEFNESLKYLRDDSKLQCLEENPGRHARLGGRLGIADLLERVGLSKEVSNIDPAKLGYDLVFVIKKNASLNPRFNVIPIGKEKTFTGGTKWTGSFSDTQTLKLVFTPPASRCEVAHAGEDWPEKCPDPVYLVNVKSLPIFRKQLPACKETKEEEKCTARASEGCYWVGEGRRGSCQTKPKPAPHPVVRRIAPKAFAPKALAPAAPISRPDVSRGISPADREELNRARSRGVLDGVESELRRQRIGN